MLDRVDRFRAGWVVLGIVLAAIIGFILLAFLGTVVFGVFLYYATRPIYRRVRARLGHPNISALFSLFVLALPLIALVGYAVAVAVQELSAFLSETDLGPYADVVEPYLDISTVVERPEELLQQLGDPGAASDLFGSAMNSLSVVGTGLLYVFIALAIAFYLLRDDHRLAGYLSLVDDERGIVRAYWDAVDDNLSSIFFGNILNALLTGVIGALAFSLLNLAAPAGLAIPYPALLGLLAGAGSLIPVVGMKIVYVPFVVLLAVRAALLGTGWGFVALVAGVSVVIVDFIPDILLRPYVSGGDLHTGTVMFAYVLGPTVFGWYGLFLGPLLLVLAAQFVRLVLPELLAGTTISSEPLGPGRLIADGPGADGTDGTDSATDGTDQESTTPEPVEAGEDSPDTAESTDTTDPG